MASAARQLCQADGVTVVLRERDHVFYVDEQAITPLWKGRRFPASSCVSGWCMQHRETVVIRDVYADERIAQDLYRPTFVKSMVMTPIRREDPVGALGAYWAAERAPSEREAGLLQTLADAAAVAIDNARLYLQLREALHVSSVQAERREEFVRWLSHDLRTPLAAISMSCAAVVPLLEQNTAVSMTGARAQLGNIRRATDRMDRLIHDLLDIAALDAGVLKLEKKSTPLSEVLETAYELAPLAEERGIKLVADAPGATDIYVSCDVHRVAQVINNLVSNHELPDEGPVGSAANMNRPVYVIDDDAVTRQSLRNFLEARGLTVVSAARATRR